MNDQQVNAFVASVGQNKAAENGFSAPASMNQENKETPSASIKAGQVVKFTYINKIEDSGIVVYVFKKVSFISAHFFRNRKQVSNSGVTI